MSYLLPTTLLLLRGLRIAQHSRAEGYSAALAKLSKAILHYFQDDMSHDHN